MMYKESDSMNHYLPKSSYNPKINKICTINMYHKMIVDTQNMENPTKTNQDLTQSAF